MASEEFFEKNVSAWHQFHLTAPSPRSSEITARFENSPDLIATIEGIFVICCGLGSLVL
jgi:hypothetical protein